MSVTSSMLRGQYNSTNDQVICDPITPLENFNVSKYVGTWFEQKHVRMIVEPNDCSCSTAEYTDLSNSVDANGFRSFKLYNSCQFEILGEWLPREGVHGDAKCDVHGTCFVSIFDQPVPKPNLHILETDYTSYAINYNCDRDLNKVFMWILTRQPVVSPAFYQKIYEKALKLAPHFNPKTFAKRDIQGKMCTYDKEQNGSNLNQQLLQGNQDLN